MRLLYRARDILGFTETYQSIFPPNPSLVPSPWNLIANSTLQGCGSEKLLYVSNTVDYLSTLSSTPTATISMLSTLHSTTSSTSTSLSAIISSVSHVLGNINTTTSAKSTANSTTNSSISVYCNTWITCREAVLLPVESIGGIRNQNMSQGKGFLY